MENLELTDEEKKELEKRGFLIKKNFSLYDLILITYQLLIYILTLGIGGIIIGVMILGFLILLTEGSGILSIIVLIISGIYLLGLFFILFYGAILFIIDFLKSGVDFYSENGVISFGKQGKNQKIKYKGGIYYLRNYYKKITNLQLQNTKEKAKVVGMIIFCFIFLIFFQYTIIQADLILKEIVILGFILGIFIFWFLFLISGRSIYQSFHPLYAFGNLGEKIQKLTPQIKEQSKKIQSEFQSDMNFSVLSDGFDSLSITFSEIVALVIKLEKVEARANKGNLFDSKKYINSLRSDIIDPLRSLREFLENQKSKLLESQKEFIQVRVGGNEASGNIELQSKRSESLITELTEYIEKLDVMIKRMG